MQVQQNRFLFWLPRILSLAFAIFITLFSLDVFSEPSPFWDKVLGFIIHLIPTLVILLILFIAWKHEWVGALFFFLLGIFYMVMTRLKMDILAYIFISGSLLLIAVLFLISWLHKHHRLKSRE